MKSLCTVVNEEQQAEILNALSGFKISKLGDKYDFPLIISFNEKTIMRMTSITACAVLAQSGMIVRDFSQTKAIIDEYLKNQEEEQE